MISIHAPARGATGSQSNSTAVAANFNPRSRKGSDKYMLGRYILDGNFNPRSRKGSDLKRWGCGS